MITLFNYYNLRIHFVKIDCTPLHVYGNRGQKSSIAQIKFNKGLFDKIIVNEHSGFAPLDPQDLDKMQLLIMNNMDEIIKRWIDFYIFDRPIEEEMITSRIEDGHFS